MSRGWLPSFERFLALDSPLTLTLVHDTYRSEDDAHELLDFCGATQQLVSRDQAAEQIKDHLRLRLAGATPHPRQSFATPGDSDHACALAATARAPI